MPTYSTLSPLGVLSGGTWQHLLGALDVRDEELVGGARGWVEELGELSAALPDAGAGGVAAKP